MNRYKDLVPVTAAFLITGILFWMDEGYYDFRWMKDPGNWFMFLLYAGGFVAAQFFISEVVLRKMTGRKKTILTVIAGVPLGILLMAGGLYGFMAICKAF